jgi:hypothetical protein
MPEESKTVLASYAEVSRFVAARLSIDAWEGESEYYSFCAADPSAGFLEVVYPVADASGRWLRGASGNGPIFIFLYRCGTWTYLGEMHGAKTTSIASSSSTEFKVYAHASATETVERHYQLFGAEYVCVSEADVTNV